MIKLPYFYSNVREKWGGTENKRDKHVWPFFFFFFCSRRVAVASFHDFFYFLFFEYQVSGIKEEKGEKSLVLFSLYSKIFWMYENNS